MMIKAHKSISAKSVSKSALRIASAARVLGRQYERAAHVGLAHDERQLADVRVNLATRLRALLVAYLW